MQNYANSVPLPNRYRNQDSMIFDSMKRQTDNARALKTAAENESTVNARYGLMLRNYLNLTIGFPELLR